MPMSKPKQTNAGEGRRGRDNLFSPFIILKHIVCIRKKKKKQNSLIKITAPPPNHRLHSIWQGCLKTQAKTTADFVCLKLSKVESNYHHNCFVVFWFFFNIAACNI